MSERKHVKAFLSPAGTGGSYIEIDGERMTNVRGIQINARVGEATTIALELINVDVEVETLVETTHIGSVNREYREAG